MWNHKTTIIFMCFSVHFFPYFLTFYVFMLYLSSLPHMHIILCYLCRYYIVSSFLMLAFMCVLYVLCSLLCFLCCSLMLKYIHRSFFLFLYFSNYIKLAFGCIYSLCVYVYMSQCLCTYILIVYCIVIIFNQGGVTLHPFGVPLHCSFKFSTLKQQLICIIQYISTP